MDNIVAIKPADLLIDEENARLSEPNEGQNESLRALATLLDGKLLTLATDIVTHGMNPSDLPIVMPAPEEPGRYIVLEGNRRLAALRALENPEWLVGVASKATLVGMRAQSKKYLENPIDSIMCAVFSDRVGPTHWIELRHTGENGGAGLVPWKSDEQDRYLARTGKKEIHTQALDFLEAKGFLSGATRKQLPVTSFRRLLGTPEVRARLALTVGNGTLQYTGSIADTCKGLMKIVNDLASRKIKVEHIYSKTQRVAYADKLPLVKPTSSGATPKPVDPSATPKKGTKAGRKPHRERDHLIPSDCRMNITDPKIGQIERELRKLSLTHMRHAASVMFRVFLELSVDHYLDREKISPGHKPKLFHKIKLVKDDLLRKQRLTRDQAKPVARAHAADSMFAPSVELMHAYVHSKHVFPLTSDLRASWDGLQQFFLAMWN